MILGQLNTLNITNLFNVNEKDYFPIVKSDQYYEYDLKDNAKEFHYIRRIILEVQSSFLKNNLKRASIFKVFPLKENILVKNNYLLVLNGELSIIKDVKKITIPTNSLYFIEGGEELINNNNDDNLLFLSFTLEE